MIQANELRIGNWVLFSPSGQKKKVKDRPVTIKELHEKTCLTIDNGLTLELFYESDSTQPIPLTPEILEKCGFIWETSEKKHIQKLMPNGRRFVFYILTGAIKTFQLYGSIPDFGLYDDEENTPKYLHQLQNLYFALTGTELIYKP